MEIQLAANIGEPVPTKEEAEAFALLYRLYKEEERKGNRPLGDEKVTITAFARRVGRSADTIRRSLVFWDLPDYIRSAVRSDVCSVDTTKASRKERKNQRAATISFGMALEFHAAQKASFSKAEMMSVLRIAITNRHTAASLREVIAGRIRAKKQPALDLFDVMQAAQKSTAVKEEERAAVRKNARQQGRASLLGQRQYLRDLKKLLEDRAIRKEDSPFRDKAVVRAYLDTVEVLAELAPHLREHVSQRKYAQTVRQIREAGEAGAVLLHVLEELERSRGG